MKIGDRIRAEFTDTSILGAGVAHVDTIAVFCPHAVAGDVAEIEITAVKKRYAEASLLRILTPSTDRMLHDCRI
ncbi:MAG: TRAM domain-containing protein, partial [Clostridia bacterium]|nr:TRAM domain-containing protein [Clostridia bacterium]